MGTKICRLCGTAKPIDDFYIRKESGRRRSECKACIFKRSKEWCAKNPDRRKAHYEKWEAKNPGHVLKRKAAYRKRHPVRYRQWNIDNPERVKELNAAWAAKNKDRIAAQVAKRRAAKKQAFLPFDPELFELVEPGAYKIAALRTELTGVPWEVDHIVPLQSDIVCGLHSEYNLAVITVSENRRKSNLYWPGMP